MIYCNFSTYEAKRDLLSVNLLFYTLVGRRQQTSVFQFWKCLIKIFPKSYFQMFEFIITNLRVSCGKTNICFFRMKTLLFYWKLFRGCFFCWYIRIKIQASIFWIIQLRWTRDNCKSTIMNLDDMSAKMIR